MVVVVAVSDEADEEGDVEVVDVVVQAPTVYTTPLQVARHALLYVTPSLPHTCSTVTSQAAAHEDGVVNAAVVVDDDDDDDDEVVGVVEEERSTEDDEVDTVVEEVESVVTVVEAVVVPVTVFDVVCVVVEGEKAVVDVAIVVQAPTVYKTLLQ